MLFINNTNLFDQQVTIRIELKLHILHSHTSHWRCSFFFAKTHKQLWHWFINIFIWNDFIILACIIGKVSLLTYLYILVNSFWWTICRAITNCDCLYWNYGAQDLLFFLYKSYYWSIVLWDNFCFDWGSFSIVRCYVYTMSTQQSYLRNRFWVFLNYFCISATAQIRTFLVCRMERLRFF